MPEQDREKKLEGKTSLTPSSDEFIISELEAIKREVDGTTGRVIDISNNDILQPKPIAVGTPPKTADVSDIEVESGFLSPEKSKFALNLLRVRQRKIQSKKAA